MNINGNHREDTGGRQATWHNQADAPATFGPRWSPPPLCNVFGNRRCLPFAYAADWGCNWGCPKPDCTFTTTGRLTPQVVAYEVLRYAQAPARGQTGRIDPFRTGSGILSLRRFLCLPHPLSLPFGQRTRRGSVRCGSGARRNTSRRRLAGYCLGPWLWRWRPALCSVALKKFVLRAISLHVP